MLIEAKAILAHGDWLRWLRGNIDISERTASDYMRLARSPENRQHAADLSIRAALKSERAAKQAARSTAQPRREAGTLSCFRIIRGTRSNIRRRHRRRSSTRLMRTSAGRLGVGIRSPGVCMVANIATHARSRNQQQCAPISRSVSCRCSITSGWPHPPTRKFRAIPAIIPRAGECSSAA